MAAAESAIVVHLRVSPTLRHRLPAFAGARSLRLELAPGATVRDAAAAIGLDLAAEGVIAVVNGQAVRADGELHDGDQLRLMHRIAGG